MGRKESNQTWEMNVSFVSYIYIKHLMSASSGLQKRGTGLDIHKISA